MSMTGSPAGALPFKGRVEVSRRGAIETAGRSAVRTTDGVREPSLELESAASSARAAEPQHAIAIAATKLNDFDILIAKLLPWNTSGLKNHGSHGLHGESPWHQCVLSTQADARHPWNS
jgi:hypothetical protein